ncbi:MAG: SseB family protein [Clostridiales bacterium]|nr:SseB family protein [Clostridiales bacterium]
MGLFGKKDDDKKEAFQITDEDLDAKIMAAIEETDEEEKQRKEEERAAEATRVAQIAEAAKNAPVPMQGTLPPRFFFMVEEASRTDSGLALKGVLHGRLEVGSKAYINRPSDSVSEAEIVSMAKDDREMPAGTKGESMILTVKISGDDAEDVSKAAPRYSVISNIAAQQEIDPKKPVENPYLMGLTLEHMRFMKDPEFMKVFARQIILAKFILPVRADLSDSANGNKKLQLVTIADKNDPSSKYLAVFTDLAAIGGAKGIFADDSKPSVTVMTLPAVSKALAGGANGLLLNPFGPSRVQIPKEFVEKVMGSFTKVPAKGKVSPLNSGKPDPKKNPGILVGKPNPTKETEAIVDALVKYASTVPDIASASLLLKADKVRRGYLFIVDCPVASQKKIAEGIKKATSPYMKEIRDSEVILRAQAPFAEGYFKKFDPDYVKN